MRNLNLRMTHLCTIMNIMTLSDRDNGSPGLAAKLWFSSWKVPLRLPKGFTGDNSEPGHLNAQWFSKTWVYRRIWQHRASTLFSPSLSTHRPSPGKCLRIDFQSHSYKKAVITQLIFPKGQETVTTLRICLVKLWNNFNRRHNRSIPA